MKRPGKPSGHGRRGPWFWVQFGTEAMMHIVHRSYLSQIVCDMERRGCKMTGLQNLPKFYMDLGGMMKIGRPDVSVGFAGVRWEMPCEEVSDWISSIKSAKVRQDEGRPYYKIKGFFMRALVLSENQRAALIRALERVEEKSNQRADEFYK